MSGIFKNSNCFVDAFLIDNKFYKYHYDSDSDEDYLFKSMNPINVCILLRCLEPLIKNVCEKFKSEKEALEAVNESINKYKESPDDKSLKYYIYEDISLIDFLEIIIHILILH